MQHNPYAAPAAGPNPPARGRLGGGTPQPWEIGEILGAAWNAFKPNWPTLTMSLLLAQLPPAIPAYTPSVLVVAGVLKQLTPLYFVVHSVCFVASVLVSSFFHIGLVRIWLAAARGRSPQLGDLFSGGPRYLAMVGCTFLTVLATLLGTALFVIPGLILSLGLAFSAFYVVDQELGPVEAVKASWEATRGQKGALFAVALLFILLTFAGLAACCLGILVTMPIAGIAWTAIYLRISGREVIDGGPLPYAPMPYTPPPSYGPPA